MRYVLLKGGAIVVDGKMPDLVALERDKNFKK